MPAFLQGIDVAVACFFQNAPRPAFLDSIMAVLTHLADGSAIWIAVTLVMLLLPRTRKMGCAAALALILSSVAVDLIIKPLAGRPRPYTELPGFAPLIPPLSSFSFPSGHAAHSFAVSAAYVLHRPRRMWPLMILAAVIAFSRVYLGMHYLTDILAGALLGILWGWLGRKLGERVYPLLEKRINRFHKRR